jgi:dipeptidyl aminopeptidase/acylaminoacyl peptidase
MRSRLGSTWSVAVAAAVTLLLTPPLPAQAAGLSPEDVAKLRAVGDAVVSPDGAYIAYTLAVPRVPFVDDDGPAWTELHLAGPDGRGRPFITGKVNVGGVAWRPDGSGVSFLAKRDGDEHRSLYVIPKDGGEARRVLSHETDIGDYDWSPDGVWVAFVADEKEPKEKKELAKKGFDQEIYEEELPFSRLYLARPESEEEPRELALDGSASGPRFSPDGKSLVVAVAPTPAVDDDLMYRRLRVVDMASGEVKARIENPGKLGSVAWSPDGSQLALLSGADLHDPTNARLCLVPAGGGVPRQLLPGIAADAEAFAWKDPRTLMVLFHTGAEASLEEVAAGDGGRRVLLAGGGPAWQSLSLSQDGRVAALLGSAPQHPPELFRWRAGHTQTERLTDSNPWLAERELGRQEVVSFTARDGLDLQGVLMRPVEERPGQRYPLILVVHGGPEAHYSNGWLTGYASPGQMGAARGFAVFYPNYRGSTGRGEEFAKSSQGDPAGKEFDDLVDAVGHLVESGLVDRAKVGITGGSYGGYASAWGATALTEHFAASVMFVGISEKIAKWGSSDIPQELNLVHDRHWPWEDWQLMLERSPVYHAPKSKTPLLILHGKEDPRVHPSQSLILYRYFKVLGRVPVRLVWYPGEGHGNRKAAHRFDYNLRMLQWFEHYLQGPGGDPPGPDLDYGPLAEEEKDEEGEGMEKGMEKEMGTDG